MRISLRHVPGQDGVRYGNDRGIRSSICRGRGWVVQSSVYRILNGDVGSCVDRVWYARSRVLWLLESTAEKIGSVSVPS